jgi:hypothetical protein
VAAVKSYKLPLLPDRLTANGFTQRPAGVGEEKLLVCGRHVFELVQLPLDLRSSSITVSSWDEIRPDDPSLRPSSTSRRRLGLRNGPPSGLVASKVHQSLLPRPLGYLAFLF